MPERPFDLDMPCDHERAGSGTEARTGHGSQRVQIGNARSRKALSLAKRDLLRDSADGRCDLDHEEARQVGEARGAAKEEQRASADGVRKGCPPDLELPRLPSLRRRTHAAFFARRVRALRLLGTRAGLARALWGSHPTRSVDAGSAARGCAR
jgi:hypothetical protein